MGNNEIKNLGIGIAIGVLIGVLVAPQSGKETQALIKGKVVGIKDKVVEVAKKIVPAR